MRNKDLLAATVEFVQDEKDSVQVKEKNANVIRNMNRGKTFKTHFAERIANEVDLNLYEAGANSLDATYLWDGNIEVSKAFAGDDTMFMYGWVQVFVNMNNQLPYVDSRQSREDVIKATPNVVIFREMFQCKIELDDNGKPDLDTLTVAF